MDIEIMNMYEKYKHHVLTCARKSAIYGFYTALITHVLAPLMVIIGNPSDFKQYIDLYLLSIIVKESLDIFILLSCTTFAAILCSKKSEQIIFCIIVALMTFSFYLPLNSGFIDGESQLVLNKTNLLVGLTLAGVAYRFFRYRHTIILILIAGPVVQSILLVTSTSQHEISNRATLVQSPISSSQKNIFVMSYDALQSHSVKQAIDALPREDKKEFDGFTFHEDVLSHGFNTRISTVLTKLGSISSPNAKNLKKLSYDDMITNRLVDNDYDVETFGFFYRHEKKSHRIITTAQKKYKYMQSLGAARLRYDLYNISNNFNKSSLFKENSRPEKLNLMSNDVKSSMIDYDFNLKHLSVGNDRPTVKFQHYLFSHPPLLWNAECSIDNKTITSANDTPKYAQLNSSKCSVKKMLEWIKKLKSLGAYDNSIIILTSDHGLGCNQISNPTHSCKRIDKKDLSRYSAFMMTKNFNSHGTLKYSKIPVSLNDIARTICSATIKTQCNMYDGHDLFSGKNPEITQFRPIAVTGKGNTYINTILAPRHISYDAFLNKYRFTEENPKNKTQVLEFSVTDIPKIVKSTHQNRHHFTGEQQTYVTNGPFINLIPGTYEFMVHYKTTSTKSNNDKIASYWEILTGFGATKIKQVPLPTSSEQFQWSSEVIHIEKETDGAGIRVQYGGHGSIEIKQIKIKKLQPTKAH